MCVWVVAQLGQKLKSMFFEKFCNPKKKHAQFFMYIIQKLFIVSFFSDLDSHGPSKIVDFLLLGLPIGAFCRSSLSQ